MSHTNASRMRSAWAAAVAAFSRNAERALSAAERIGLLGGEWWMVRSGRHDVGAVLDLAAALAGDTTPAITDSIAGRVSYVAEYLVDDPERPAFQSWVRAKFGPPLDQLGVPGQDNDEQRHSRRAALLDLVGMWGNAQELHSRARELATKYLTDPTSLPPTLAPAVLRLAAYGGDAALYDQYPSRMKASSSQPEVYYRYLESLPYFRDPALIDRTLALSLTPYVRTQDAGLLITGVLSHPWGRDAAWAFVTREWTRLTDRLGTFQGLPTIVTATGNFCSSDAAAKVKQFFAEHPLPSAERTLQQSIERIDGCVALEAGQAPALKAWLGASSASSVH